MLKRRSDSLALASAARTCRSRCSLLAAAAAAAACRCSRAPSQAWRAAAYSRSTRSVWVLADTSCISSR